MLHRPVELARVTGQVVLVGFRWSGYGVNQDLAGPKFTASRRATKFVVQHIQRGLRTGRHSSEKPADACALQDVSLSSSFDQLVEQNLTVGREIGRALWQGKFDVECIHGKNILVRRRSK